MASLLVLLLLLAAATAAIPRPDLVLGVVVTVVVTVRSG